MGGIRYIGSKARLRAKILDLVGPPSGDGRFVDAFCGTGSVAAEAATRGWRVHVNDNLTSATILARALLIGETDVSFGALGGYPKAVERLNDCFGVSGYFTRTYSPVSAAMIGFERRYFTRENAEKIDAARKLIDQWLKAQKITLMESQLLIADLMEAANRVANIAGTYGCFLKTWSSSAMRPLIIKARVLRANPVSHQASTQGAIYLDAGPGDTVYIDPPYTKRQYAAYYHLLETLAIGDEPEVSGVCGIRPWKHLSSPFCHKRKAAKELVDTINRFSNARVAVSYSSEGHADLEQVAKHLDPGRKPRVVEVSKISRYRPNVTAAKNGDTVGEFLLLAEPLNAECERPEYGGASEACPA